MKTLIILLYLSLPVCVMAQKTETGVQQNWIEKELIPVRSIDPADIDFSDLEPLKTKLKNVRIVLLGEQTHGEGSAFMAKSRIIKFLHEEMGFDVLAFESGFYDCARIWDNVKKGNPLTSEVIGSLFYMYATSNQMASLFDYIQKSVNTSHELVLSGFESQHSGVKAKTDLFTEFENFLESKNPLLKDVAWEIFKRLSLATFNSRDYRPNEEEKKIFFKKISGLKKALKSYPENNTHYASSPGFWYRILCSIESQAKRYWQLVSGNEVSVRDLEMANNFIWLAEKFFPGRKIIIWAHNGHIAKKTKDIVFDNAGKNGFYNTFIPMGQTISKHFGKKSYAIGFTGWQGSYANYVNDSIETIQESSQGIESILAKTKDSMGFLDYRHSASWLMQKQKAKLGDYNDGLAVWPEVFDGIFYIRKSFPVIRKK